MEAVANPVTVLYQRDWNQRETDSSFNALVTLADALAAGTSNPGTPSGLMTFNWCVDPDQANDLAAFYLAEHAQSNSRVTVPLLTRHMDLQSGDIVKLNYPDWNLENVFSRVEAGRKVMLSGSGNMMDHLELTFRLFPIAALLEALSESTDVSEALDLIARFVLDLGEIVLAEEKVAATDFFIQSQTVDALDTFSTDTTAYSGETADVNFHVGTLDQAVLQETSAVFDQAFMDAEGFGIQAFGISGYGGKEALA